MPGTRVLVVSQDRWLLDRLRDVLEAEGVETEIALSGAVGMNIAVERRVDLLVADEAVEDFNNVRKIKDPASSTYRLPAIVIKANGGAPKEDVMRLFPCAIMNRNFDAKDLIVNVKQALSPRPSKAAKVRSCA